MEDRIMNRS